MDVRKFKTRDFHHIISVASNHFCTPDGRRQEWIAQWIIPSMAKPVLIDDVVCMLEGASEPTVIRFRSGDGYGTAHFDIIALSIGAPTSAPPNMMWTGSPRKFIGSDRKFQLVWDWGSGRDSRGSGHWREFGMHFMGYHIGGNELHGGRPLLPSGGDFQDFDPIFKDVENPAPPHHVSSDYIPVRSDQPFSRMIKDGLSDHVLD